MPRVVTAPNDSALDAYRDVGDHAALMRAGLFVVEGRFVVERLLLDRRFRVHSIAVTPAAAEAMTSLFEDRPDVEVLIADPSTLEHVTGYDFHRGCLALAWRQSSPVSLDAIIHARSVLAIEGVGNPDNVGGLFRSALAFGVEAVLVDPTTADPLYRKAIRTSMGATLRVPYRRTDRWHADLNALRAGGMRVVALTPHPDATALNEMRLEPGTRIVFVVGSEGAGLTEATMALADLRVRIPIDPRADSLNVVVAASIALSMSNAECRMANAE